MKHYDNADDEAEKVSLIRVFIYMFSFSLEVRVLFECINIDINEKHLQCRLRTKSIMYDT